MNEESEKSEKKLRVFTLIGLVATVIGLGLSFIPFVGAYGGSIALMGFIFSGFSFHLFRKSNIKSIAPTAGLILGAIGMGIGVYQYYKFSKVFQGVEEIRNEKDKLLIGLVKKEMFGIGKEDSVKSKAAQIINESQLNETQSFTIDSDEVNTPNAKYVYSILDNFRIRAEPNTSSEILGKLSFGERLEYLEEKSFDKDSISLNGKMRYENWYKVRRKPFNYNHQIVGWLYGGGIVFSNDDYTYDLDNNTFKTIAELSNVDLNRMLDFQIDEPFAFNGLISYSGNTSSENMKNGRFYLFGYSEKGASDFNYERRTVRYQGIYKNGKLNGVLNKKYSGHESFEETNITFEEGKCIAFKMERNSEGEIERHISQSPSDCSFDFIERGLRSI